MLLIERALCQQASSLILIVCASLGLAGCATTETSTRDIEPLPLTQIEDSGQFGQETLYALIAAEIGLVRDRYELGLNNYVQQARDTQDVNITARAAQVARILKRHDEALEMAELWRKLDEGSHEARYILVAEYITAERFDEAFAEADKLLRAGYSPGFDDIAIDAVQKKYTQLETLQAKFQSTLIQYPDNTELLIGLSVFKQALGQLSQALVYAESAENTSPDNVRAVYQHFRVLGELEREQEATEAYARLVQLQPDNIRMRNSYARMLIKSDLDAALEQYTILHQQAPKDPDVILNLALILTQFEKYNEAKSYFETLIEREKHLSVSSFYLGEIAKVNEDFQSALSHYQNVKEGHRLVQAVSEAAGIIKQLRSLEEARAYVSERRESAPEEHKESLYLVEASALSVVNQRKQAIQLLNNAISSYPDSVKLRYERAMQFASLREPLLAERDFKHILSLNPDNAATLNALGYTLLDQTDRIDEAGQYISKALELNADDAATLDSMGWYFFKRGKTQKAINYLQRAFDQYIDDEIAAHLGEALWSIGKKTKAKRVWQQGFEDDPNSPIILETLNRLNINWP